MRRDAQKPRVHGRALGIIAMKEWIEIERPVDIEADLSLKDQAPPEVRDEYDRSRKNSFIAWVSSDSKLIGCIKNNRSISVDFSLAAAVVLYEMEPAKGSGYVGLDITTKNGECLAIIDSSRYSKKSLQWLKHAHLILAKVFQLEERYEYHGKDA